MSMYRKNQKLNSLILIFSLMIAVTACKDSKDEQTNQDNDSSKPVMRCAP